MARYTPPLPPYVQPPAWLGLQWQMGELLHTRHGPRYLSRAVRTPAFDQAIDAEVVCFWDLGLTRESENVLFWQAPDHDLDAVQTAIDSIPGRVAAREVERAAAAAARQAKEEAAAAAEVQRIADLVARAREEATRSLKDRRWSWARRVDADEAQGLLQRPDLDVADAMRLLSLVERAGKNVARSEVKLAVMHEGERALAERPNVRSLALEAVRLITAEDADWATLENGRGWSKSATIDGHVLDALPELDVAQASHALRLLRVHHKQLPRAVVESIFAAA
ncbi:hypothetical protein [Methylobacterium sp. Leaf91]|uniref:hypothetical protein n=1 Tax=Methylobacterium sp. Leaf91 TaxID=1736247 RepID=UPI0006F29717|nr:hypothetical protein [Methylobacterium sp. Leaf91]KQO85935.1 hypothetical protein ASF32_09620 [Methylobacterium sp. Leaf91]